MLKDIEKPDQKRIDFYTKLNQIYYRKIWEVCSLKSFVDEEYGEDELFFY